jgi:hypothetical protein
VGADALGLNSTGNSNTAIGAKALKKSLGTKKISIDTKPGLEADLLRPRRALRVSAG